MVVLLHSVSDELFFIHLNRVFTHLYSVVQTSLCWKRERGRERERRFFWFLVIHVFFDQWSCR